MKITLIRNTTMLIEYGGARFLVDPVFGAKGSKESIPGSSLYPEVRNPMTDLPMTPEEIVKDIDAVIITHIHPDHLDLEAAKLIPKDIPVFVQNLQDKDSSRNYGFNKKHTVDMTPWTSFRDISVLKAPGKHGVGTMMQVLIEAGNSGGFVLKKEGEKTLYVTGDTIFYYGVTDMLTKYRPDVVVAYAGGCVKNGMRLHLDCEELKKIHEFSPASTLVAVHLEAWNHCTITRSDVASYAQANGFSESLRIPKDGETLLF